ncbi:hypothetical protein L9F63_012370, partial [Diploptera punctata]
FYAQIKLVFNANVILKSMLRLRLFQKMTLYLSDRVQNPRWRFKIAYPAGNRTRLSLVLTFLSMRRYANMLLVKTYYSLLPGFHAMKFNEIGKLHKTYHCTETFKRLAMLFLMLKPLSDWQCYFL